VQWSFAHQSAAQFMIGVAVTVPAGKTASIVHGIAQRRINAMP